MNKSINFRLNKFPSVPHVLRKIPLIDEAKTEFTIDLARLYHHYNMDKWGNAPIDPDPGNFEYLRYLYSSNDFRLLESAVSTSSSTKREVSFRLGQAFCRYFLYEFCGITYFAHMDKVLERPLHPAFDGMRISRRSDGDVPDYLCAKSVIKPYIAEAKGRFTNISFASAEFKTWREQFTRIKVADKYGINKKLKGYIVGTKFVTDKNSPITMPCIMAEDPETIGEEYISGNQLGLGKGCIALHYAELIYKLGFNLLAASLDEGFIVPNDIQYQLPVWECHYPPLQGERFVGGYIGDSELHFQQQSNGHAVFYPNILRLGIPSPTFFGLRASTFRILRKVCMGQWDMLSEIPELPDTEFRGSNIAWLRDGSVSGSLDFFSLAGTETF